MISRKLKTTLIFATLVIMAELVLLFVIKDTARKHARDEGYAEMEMTARVKRATFESSMNEQLTLVLQLLRMPAVKEYLKNPNDAAEIEAFLTQHPDILESSSPYNFIQEVRPGSLKQYSKYFASALGTLPFIMTNNNE